MARRECGFQLDCLGSGWESCLPSSALSCCGRRSASVPGRRISCNRVSREAPAAARPLPLALPPSPTPPPVRDPQRDRLPGPRDFGPHPWPQRATRGDRATPRGVTSPRPRAPFSGPGGQLKHRSRDHLHQTRPEPSRHAVSASIRDFLPPPMLPWGNGSPAPDTSACPGRLTLAGGQGRAGQGGVAAARQARDGAGRQVQVAVRRRRPVARSSSGRLVQLLPPPPHRPPASGAVRRRPTAEARFPEVPAAPACDVGRGEALPRARAPASRPAQALPERPR